MIGAADIEYVELQYGGENYEEWMEYDGRDNYFDYDGNGNLVHRKRLLVFKDAAAEKAWNGGQNVTK